MKINEILKYLPHRYPFLLVDKVLSYQEATSLQAIKNVTVNEPFFSGHFPGEPVMPGVLMVEALAQASGLLMAKDLRWPENHGNLCYFAGIDKVRFKQIVSPGDQLLLDVKLLARRKIIWKFETQALVEGKVVCSAEITIAEGSRD